MKAPSVRTRHGAVETAINVYRHPSGHEVTLVGTIHVASQRYYDELRAFLVEADEAGSAIHYEFVRKAGEEELATALDKERDAVARMRAVKMTKVMADLIALPSQHVILPLPEHWRNVDVSDLDTVRAHIDDLSFIDQMEKTAKSFADLDEAQRRFLRRVALFTIRHINGFRTVLSVLKALRLKPSTMREEFVLDHRNALAIHTALGESRSVFLAWGAGHLPGMHKLLRDAGYAHISTRWLTALERDEELLTEETEKAA